MSRDAREFCPATGKVSYPDRGAANVHAVSLRRRWRSTVMNVESYRCRHCGAWHVGRSARFGRPAAATIRRA